MNPLRSVISRHLRRSLRASGKIPTQQQKPRRQRLGLEALEDRLVLSPTVSIANASMNEIGNVSTFVPSGSGGLSGAHDLVLGPDGNIYVASSGTNSVIRYSPTGQLLGTFVAAGSGGLSNPWGLAFGPDGNLYVDSGVTNAVYEYSGRTGAFLGTFVASGSGGLSGAAGMVFGPDGNLYVSSINTESIDRFEGPAGSNPGSPLPATGQTGAYFVPPDGGGLSGPRFLMFGPNGNLYVSSTLGAGVGNVVPTNADLGILEYNGTTGAFITAYVGSGTSGIHVPNGFAFDQEGRLYVASGGIHRFDSQGNYLDDPVTAGAASASSFEPTGMIFDSQGALLAINGYTNSIVQYNSGVVVSLSAPSATPVSVQYTTSDGTATAGTDYTAQTGTVTFAPGQTSLLIPLVTLYNRTPPANDSFNVQLSNPTGGATISNGNAVVTIVPPTLPELTISNTSAIEGDPTAHYRGAAAYGAPYDSFLQATIGPDGNLYTAFGDGGSGNYDTIVRYNGTTGAFMGTFATGPINGPRDIVFHNGYMYVASTYTNQVLQYDATTGAYLGVFVTAGSGGINGPDGMTFGLDGNLYVSGTNSNNVVEYDGNTGAYLRTFVASGSGGLSEPAGIAFDSSGQYVYVAEWGGAHEVLKYNGQTGAYVGVAANGLSSPRDVKFGADGLLYVLDAGTNRIERFTENGTYVDDYVPAGSGGMSGGGSMNFGPNGDLYVVGGNANQILQFGTENEALFTVSLSTPFAEPVTVNYATADGTAIAGTNYAATGGTLTFAPGVTTQTIRVPIIDSGSQISPLAFTVNLSNPQLATLSQSQGTGMIAPSDPKAKFYVVNGASPSNGGTNTAFKYQASGAEQAPYGLSVTTTNPDLSPRGVAANAAGTMEWVVDANKNVCVYSPSGTLLGSWSAGGLSSSATITGITTNGTDIWLVDSYSDKVYKFTGAASRLSGTQNAASSFSLAGGHNGDPNPQDIVSDGTSFWVVDGSKLKVFKYTLSGSLSGSWSIDPANTHPTGITINPNNVSDIWIVDNGTDKVYQYVGAASRTSGSQSAGATFALAAGNTNPQGIADPPTANMLLTPAAASSTSNGEGTTAPSSLNIPSSDIPSSSNPMSVADQLFANIARILSDATNAYQAELSSVTAIWQSADDLAMQHLDAMLSMEAGAMGMTKDTLMRDLVFAS